MSYTILGGHTTTRPSAFMLAHLRRPDPAVPQVRPALQQTRRPSQYTAARPPKRSAHQPSPFRRIHIDAVNGVDYVRGTDRHEGSRQAAGTTAAAEDRQGPTGPVDTRTRPESAATAHTGVSTHPRKRTDDDLTSTTEQLLRRRGCLPAGHPDRESLRARVIEANLPLARHLARRYAGRGEPLEDLDQVAALALIKVVDRYDPTRETTFASYAIPSILGELKRHFRDTAWAMRVPRRTQELSRAVVTATSKLSQELGHSPTPTELAEHLHVCVDDVLIAIGAAGAYQLRSLHAPSTSAETPTAIDLLGGIDARYAGVDNQLMLLPLLAALSARDQRILTLRFYGNMTQAQIAVEVGLSQMHVSRLLTRSLTWLRAAALSDGPVRQTRRSGIDARSRGQVLGTAVRPTRSALTFHSRAAAAVS